MARVKMTVKGNEIKPGDELLIGPKTWAEVEWRVTTADRETWVRVKDLWVDIRLDWAAIHTIKRVTKPAS